MRKQHSIFTCWTILVFGLGSLSGMSAELSGFQKKGGSAPEVVDVTTSDMVKLKCEYYPGAREKESVPVILLHEWDGDRKSKFILQTAGFLQQQLGCAVIVPDLRGHGESLNVQGSDMELNRDQWRAAEIAAIMEDIEACKKFLVKKNNEGLLNIDMLTVIAHGESTIPTIAWTIRDWSYEPLGGIKQGKDVKALVLIDPKRSFRGLNATDGFRNPLLANRQGDSLPLMIAAGTKASRESGKIFDSLQRLRRGGDKTNDSLEYYRYKVQKQQRVVKQKNKDAQLLDQLVGQFIESRVVARKHDFRWQDRSLK